VHASTSRCIHTPRTGTVLYAAENAKPLLLITNTST
jgi:hypothetical protein